MFSCAGVPQQEMAQAIRDKGINRVVVAACSPKTHEGTFHGVLIRAGLNPYLLEMVNLRNQDSWVHKDFRQEATEKAKDMVRMGVEKARRLQPLEPRSQPVVQRALVIGGGIAGMTAAANLAGQGFETHLVEREPELGGTLRCLDTLWPSGISAREVLRWAEEELTRAGVRVHLGTEVEVIGGYVGNFSARLTDGEELKFGAVVLATGAHNRTSPRSSGTARIPGSSRTWSWSRSSTKWTPSASPSSRVWAPGRALWAAPATAAPP